MPRQLDGTELFRFLTDLSVYRIVAGGGDQTITPSLTVGMTTASVGATTSFTSGDPVAIVGSGGTELNQVSGTVAIAMPLQYKVAFAQNAGARLVELVRQQLGHLDPAGPIFTGSQQLTPIFSSISRGAIQYLYGPGEMGFDLGLQGFNGPNLHTIFGIPEAETGAGTPTDPYQAPVSGLAMGTQGLQCFRALGVRYDGKSVILDFNDAKIAAQGQVNLAGDKPTYLPCTMKFLNAVLRYYT